VGLDKEACNMYCEYSCQILPSLSCLLRFSPGLSAIISVCCRDLSTCISRFQPSPVCLGPASWSARPSPNAPHDLLFPPFLNFFHSLILPYIPPPKNGSWTKGPYLLIWYRAMSSRYIPTLSLFARLNISALGSLYSSFYPPFPPSVC